MAPPPPPPPVDFPPASATSGGGDGSLLSQASRTRFIKVRRPFKSGATSNDRQHSASDSSDPADRCSNESAGSGFVFGSSQFLNASNLIPDSQGFCEKSDQLKFGDSQSIGAEPAAMNLGAKGTDAIFDFCFGGKSSHDQHLESGAFIFKGNADASASSCAGRSKSFNLEPKSQYPGIDVAAGTDTSYLNTPFASLRQDTEAPPLCQVNASGEHPTQSDVDIDSSSVNLSHQSAATASIVEPSLSIKNADTHSLKPEMFSKLMGMDPCRRNKSTGRRKFEKKGKSIRRSAVNFFTEKQHLTDEKGDMENSSTSDCYSPMDFSPYQEIRVDHQFSPEKQTNEPASGDCVPKVSCSMGLPNGEDLSSRLGDGLSQVGSGSAAMGTVSGINYTAPQDGSDPNCSNSVVDNPASSGSEKSDQGGFTLSASGHNSGNANFNSAASASTQGSTMKDSSFSVSGEGVSTSYGGGISKEVTRGMVSRKLRPRLVKLRKQSHGRSEAASTHPNAGSSYAVPDGLLQVKLNYDASTTSDNTATQDTNSSCGDPGFVSGGSCEVSASNESVEECFFSESEKHGDFSFFSNANKPGGLQSTSQLYEGECPTAINVNGSDLGDKKVFGFYNGSSHFGDSNLMSKCKLEDNGEKKGTLSSSGYGNRRTDTESGPFPTDLGPDNGIFIFKSFSSRSTGHDVNSPAKSDQGPKPNCNFFVSSSDIPRSGMHMPELGHKGENILYSKLPDAMHKLNIHDGGNIDGNNRSKVTENVEPSVISSCTDASDIHSVISPSSFCDQIKNQGTGLGASVENQSYIGSAGTDHIMFGHGEKAPCEYPSDSINKPFIFQTGTPVNSSDYNPSDKPGSKDVLSSLSATDGGGTSKGSVTLTEDPVMLNSKFCLFPELKTEYKFSERARLPRKKKHGKQGTSRSSARVEIFVGKQNVSKEDKAQEKLDIPNCFSSVDFSLSNGHETMDQFSRKSPAEPAGDFMQSFRTVDGGLEGSTSSSNLRGNYCSTDTTDCCSRAENANSSIKERDINLSKLEEFPCEMQFSFASGVDKENRGFVFSASAPVGSRSPGRKRPHKKNSVQRTSVSSVFHPDSNSSDLPSEPTSSPKENASSCLPESQDNSNLKGQEKSGRKEVSSSASIQEACEKWRFSGNQAYKKGHFSRAERFYTKGINLVPPHETSGCCLKPLLLCYSNRAATRMSVGRLREAIDDCTKATVLDPNFLKVQIRKANCYLVLGEIENAISCFDKCVESGASVCLDRRLIIEAAEGLQRAQKVAERINLSAKLLEEKCYDAASKALEIISETLTISKFSEKLLQMKAEALYKLRRYQEVIQLCEQSLIIAQKNIPILDVRNGSENVEIAQSDGKMSIKLWRFFWMAKSNFSLGMLDAALNLLQKVENFEFTAVGSLSELRASASLLSTTIRKVLDCKNSGNEAFRSKKFAEAVECYTTALSGSNESRPFAAICFCNRAAAHQALGQIADAIADCSLAIALDGNYVKAVSRRAALHQLIRNYAQAAADDCKFLSILQNKSNQNSRLSGGSSDQANELRKAYSHKSSMEEEAKKEIPLDFYLILGVKKTDTAADIKKAYRRAALRHHPDKTAQFLRSDSGYEGHLWKEIAESVHEDADRLFKIIGEAYAVLSDSAKRAKYDLEEEIRNTPKESSGCRSYGRNSSDFYDFSPRRSSSRRYGHEHWKTYGNSSSRW